MKGKRIHLLSAILLYSVLILPIANSRPIAASSPTIFLQPSNNIFYSNATTPGTRFNITVWVENSPDIGTWQVYCGFNDSIVNATRWWEPTIDPQYIFYGKTTVAIPTPPNPGYVHLGAGRGRIQVAGILFPTSPHQLPRNGTGKLCILEFVITAPPPVNGYVSCPLEIDNADTFILDPEGNNVLGVTKQNGSYFYFYGQGAQPSKLSFSATPNPAYKGQPVTVTGRLTSYYDNPIGNSPIDLYLSTDNTTWNKVGSLTTNASGFFSAKGTPTSVGTYFVKAYHKGSTLYAPSSHIETLIILDKFTTQIFLRIAPNPASPNQTVAILGVLLDMFSSPFNASTISFRYSVDYGLNWHYFGAAITNQYGIFSATFNTPSIGVYIIRADYSGSTVYEPSTATAALIVRQP